MIVDEIALLTKLRRIKINEKIFKVMPSKEDGFTILCESGKASVYINSKYNPKKSGEQFAKSVYINKDIAIYGLGLGYHIKPLAEMLCEDQMLYVFESSMQITKIAIEKTDILQVLRKDNVVFFCSDNLNELALFMDNVINRVGGELVVYEPSLNTIPLAMNKLKDILFEYKSAMHMHLQHKSLMEENSKKNLSAGYRNGAKLYSGAFKQMPAIVVAAGASLDKNVAELLNVRDKALIISVTRAAKTLESAGVEPDFYIASDAGGWLSIHLNYDTMKAPLFLLSTADSGAADYKGEKLIIFEKNSTLNKDKSFYVEAGGSVATIAISLCAVMEANPIVFIGQDLCFSYENSHSGTSYGKTVELRGGKYVKANDGNEYYTSGSLYIFLKWIERFIARNKDINFFNATARGALIEGAKNINLTEFFKNYPDIREKINKIKETK